MQKKILVVEDDLPISEMLAEILVGEGYQVEVANNGQEAMIKLETVLPVHLILLDLMMPVMDGFRFRDEQVKNPKWSHIPIVVMSADGHVQEKVKRLGNVCYLRKPPDLDELLNTVKKNIL